MSNTTHGPHLPPPATKTAESWWTQPTTREEFQRAMQRELPRMLESRIGRWLDLRQGLSVFDLDS